jgi:poly(A) polymerase
MFNLYSVFEKAGYSLFLVGGSVRDELLGLPPGDLDYATDALPGDAADILSEKGIKTIPTGALFGTVTAFDANTQEKFEITTFRSKEIYRRGSRHPRVEFGKSIEDDLYRRDFTINAMAKNSKGELIDPCGGLRDIERRLIDTPCNPDSAFMDDPLRILRAYRFAAKLGFTISERVRKSARNYSLELSTISAERKYKELTGLLTADCGQKSADALSMMKQDGVLMRVLPELENLFVIDGLKQGRYHRSDAWQHTLDVVAHVPPIAVLRWAALLHDSAKGLVRTVDAEGEPHFYGHDIEGEKIADSVSERLRFSRADKRALCVLVRNHMSPVQYRPEWGNSAVKRLMRNASDQLANLFLLAEADINAHSEDFVKQSLGFLGELQERTAKLDTGRIIPPQIGQNLLAMGFEGPVIGRVISILEDMAADGLLPENPTVDQCFSALWDKQSKILNNTDGSSD